MWKWSNVITWLGIWAGNDINVSISIGLWSYMMAGIVTTLQYGSHLRMLHRLFLFARTLVHWDHNTFQATYLTNLSGSPRPVAAFSCSTCQHTEKGIWLKPWSMYMYIYTYFPIVYWIPNDIWPKKKTYWINDTKYLPCSWKYFLKK